MSVFSIISLKNLNTGLDISAEHYHPDKLKIINFLNESNGEKISDIVNSIKRLYNPQTSEGCPDFPIYDLGAARKHIISPEDAFQEERKSSKKIARGGDVIVSRLRSYLKQIAFVPKNVDSIYVSTEFIVLRGKNEIAYLIPFFLSDQIQTILTWSREGNEHPRFSEHVLLNLKIPKSILKKKEVLNQKILSASDLLLSSREIYNQTKNLLIQELKLKDISLDYHLTYTVSFSEVKNGKRYDAEYYQPKYRQLLRTFSSSGFKVTALDQIIEPIRNGFDFRKFEDFGTPYIRVGDVKEGQIDIDNAARVPIDSNDVKKEIQLKVGDVLFTRKGSFGNVAVVLKGQENAIISSEIMLLRIIDSDICPDYLSLFLNSPLGVTQVEQKIHGDAFYSITQQDLASLKIIEAPKELQEKIKQNSFTRHRKFEQGKSLINEAKEDVEKIFRTEGF